MPGEIPKAQDGHAAEAIKTLPPAEMIKRCPWLASLPVKVANRAIELTAEGEQLNVQKDAIEGTSHELAEEQDVPVNEDGNKENSKPVLNIHKSDEVQPVQLPEVPELLIREPLPEPRLEQPSIKPSEPLEQTIQNIIDQRRVKPEPLSPVEAAPPMLEDNAQVLADASEEVLVVIPETPNDVAVVAKIMPQEPNIAEVPQLAEDKVSPSVDGIEIEESQPQIIELQEDPAALPVEPIETIEALEADLQPEYEVIAMPAEIVEMTQTEEPIVAETVPDIADEEFTLIPELAEVVITEEVPDFQMLQTELPFLVFDQPKTEIITENIIEQIEQKIIAAQLMEHIETLEPAKAEESAAILDVITYKIQLLHEILRNDDSHEAPEVIQQQLEILCTRMLVCMGIEPKPETVKHLILALRQEYTQQVAAEQTEQDVGTHERKLSFAHLMNDFDDLIHPLSRYLGQYALSNSTVL